MFHHLTNAVRDSASTYQHKKGRTRLNKERQKLFFLDDRFKLRCDIDAESNNTTENAILLFGPLFHIPVFRIKHIIDRLP